MSAMRSVKVTEAVNVTAYYAPISKTLLHIELIDEIDTPSELN